MNLFLVEKIQEFYDLSPCHPRFEAVSRLKESSICVGVVNGPRGVGRISREGDGHLKIDSIRWEEESFSAPSIELVVGLPRPAEVRRIVLQAVTMGLRALTFVTLDRTPSGYSGSRALEPDSLGRLALEAMEQGFHTAKPEIRMVDGLDSFLEGWEAGDAPFILDPYLGNHLLGEEIDRPPENWRIILGSERGFSPREQQQILSSQAHTCHLGPSILRTETAVVSALTLAQRRIGYSAGSERAIIQLNEAGSC